MENSPARSQPATTELVNRNMPSGDIINNDKRHDVLLINIQFLRFIAAALVLFFHSVPALYSMLNIPFNPRDNISTIAFSGVDLFFVISGFIIYYTNNHIHSAKESLVFISSRVARIYLGYWPFFCMAIAVLFFLHPSSLQNVDFFSSFFILPDNYEKILIQVSWTLSLELYFYFIFFIILFFEKRIQIIAGLFFLVLIFNIYANYTLDTFSWDGHKNLGPYQHWLTSPWLLEFFCGCAIAHLIKAGHSQYPVTILITGLAIFLLAYYLNATSLHGKLERLPNHHYRIFLLSCSASCIIYGLVNLEKKGWVIFPKFSILFGGASYALYLCHRIFLDGLAYSGMKTKFASLPFPPALTFLFLILSIQLFAVIYYYYIENPVYKCAKIKIRSFFLSKPGGE
jgi:exopolysaccharide production protein ExoZ